MRNPQFRSSSEGAAAPHPLFIEHLKKRFNHRFASAAEISAAVTVSQLEILSHSLTRELELSRLI
jgi:hypothetical protein